MRRGGGRRGGRRRHRPPFPLLARWPARGAGKGAGSPPGGVEGSPPAPGQPSGLRPVSGSRAQGTAPPSHLGLSLSLQAPAEGEAKEEVGAASSVPVPPPPRTCLHVNYEAPAPQAGSAAPGGGCRLGPSVWVRAAQARPLA